MWAEVDQICSVDNLICTTVVILRSDCGLCHELAAISYQRSIVCLWVFWMGGGTIGALFVVRPVFLSFLSPASPPPTFYCLSFLPCHGSLVFYLPRHPPSSSNSILIGILHNPTSTVNGISLDSFASVSSLLLGWCRVLHEMSRHWIWSVSIW